MDDTRRARRFDSIIDCAVAAPVGIPADGRPAGLSVARVRFAQRALGVDLEKLEAGFRCGRDEGAL